MLTIEIPEFYTVKSGQTLRDIAEAFGVSARVLAQKNGLTEEPFAGRVLRIPDERGNAFTASEGQTRTLLCGSEERFLRLNGTSVLYPGMRVLL